MFLAHVRGVEDNIQEAPHSQPDRRQNRGIANQAFGAIKAQHAAERTVIEAFGILTNAAHQLKRQDGAPATTSPGPSPVEPHEKVNAR